MCDDLEETPPDTGTNICDLSDISTGSPRDYAGGDCNDDNVGFFEPRRAVERQGALARAA